MKKTLPIALAIAAAALAHFARAQEPVDPRIAAYDKGPATIDVSKWPCPTVDEGPAGCKKRFWPDGDARRSPRGFLRGSR